VPGFAIAAQLKFLQCDRLFVGNLLISEQVDQMSPGNLGRLLHVDHGEKTLEPNRGTKGSFASTLHDPNMEVKDGINLPFFLACSYPPPAACFAAAAGPRCRPRGTPAECCRRESCARRT